MTTRPSLSRLARADRIENWVMRMLKQSVSSDRPCKTMNWDLREQCGKVSLPIERVSLTEISIYAKTLRDYLAGPAMRDPYGLLWFAKILPLRRHEWVPVIAVKLEQDEDKLNGCVWCIHDWMRARKHRRQIAGRRGTLAKLIDVSPDNATRYRNQIFDQLDGRYCAVMERIARQHIHILPQQLRTEILND